MWEERTWITYDIKRIKDIRSVNLSEFSFFGVSVFRFLVFEVLTFGVLAFGILALGTVSFFQTMSKQMTDISCYIMDLCLGKVNLTLTKISNSNEIFSVK